MTVSKEITLPTLLGEMIESNLKEDANPKYIHFLCNVQTEVVKDD